jgi:hypothetical protein
MRLSGFCYSDFAEAAVFYLSQNPQFRPVYGNYTEQILILSLELMAKFRDFFVLCGRQLPCSSTFCRS